MNAIWRLIIDPPAPGARNMAVDVTLLERAAAGDAVPTLRLYAWQPFCLSIGVGQRAHDADPDRLRAAGIDLIRRPTGGRAVLHADEVTYSLTLPAGHPLAAGNILDSYRRISAGLIAALERLGAAVEPRPLDARPDQPPSPVCFEVASDYEITARGRKLIGSAQMRRAGAVLQHGSLPLSGDPGAIGALLRYPDEAARAAAQSAVRAHATTLTDVLGSAPSVGAVQAALIAGFTETFDVTLTPGTLSPAERDQADALYAARFAADSWTLRR